MGRTYYNSSWFWTKIARKKHRITGKDVIIWDKKWQTSAIFCFSCSSCSLSFSRFFISCMALPASLAAPLYCAMLLSLSSALAYQNFKTQTTKSWVKFYKKTQNFPEMWNQTSQPTTTRKMATTKCMSGSWYLWCLRRPRIFENTGTTEPVQRYWCET